IRMFTETLLLGRVGSEQERKECLQVIGQETERLSRLVERILDFSRMEKGRRAYRMEPCDVREVVERAIAICRAQAEEAGMKIELSIQDELPEIRGDRDSLVEVVVNLLSNAVKYSPRGGRIGINVAAEKEWLKIRVSDEGIGIPRSEQKKIFEKFYRVDNPRAAEVGGSGLGLSLVKYIVQAHGGTVEVNSAPGEGSTFTVTLPLPGPMTRRDEQ
ncbi:MAG: sensor histidine kinase, partial [Deltaproteobacteria bacterium]